jgi:hypothetical protein
MIRDRPQTDISEFHIFISLQCSSLHEFVLFTLTFPENQGGTNHPWSFRIQEAGDQVLYTISFVKQKRALSLLSVDQG